MTCTESKKNDSTLIYIISKQMLKLFVHCTNNQNNPEKIWNLKKKVRYAN